LHVLAIQFHPARSVTLPPPGSHLLVSEAFLFGPFQRLGLDEQPLSFVSSSSPTPPQNDCYQRRVLARSASEGRIARQEKDEVI
jgi:hypothetical protein